MTPSTTTRGPVGRRTPPGTGRGRSGTGLGAGSSRRPGPAIDSRLKRIALAVCGAVAGAALLAGGTAVTLANLPTDAPRLDLVVAQDNRTGIPDYDALREVVAQDADAIAATGDGTLALWTSAGIPAQLVGEYSLAVERDGRPEGNADMRRTEIESRLDDAFDDLSDVVPEGAGRSYWAMLNPLSGHRPAGSWDIYLVTFGMPVGVDPEDSSVLTAADPAAAVASLPDSAVPSIPGARVHLVFLPPAGDQPSLNSRTSAWRTAYVTAYIERAQGVVASVVEIGGIGTAAPGAPDAPLVENIVDPTPVPPEPPVAGTPYSVVVNAQFQPDSADFVDESAARAELQVIADAWGSGAYTSVVCEARAAAFGSPESSLQLTQLRADHGADILRELGVPTVTAVGLGHDHPLPGIHPQAPEQRDLRCTLLP